jgi:excinuclease ABC subunit C
MNLKEKRESLPSLPGVYLMKDSLNNIIYVGKSKNLKSRVNSYFQNSQHPSPKVEKLVKNLKDFDYILTDTEFEAFLLECKLIKEIKPTYNRLMKNSNCYVYIKVKTADTYPDFEICTEVHNDDGNSYLGPYTSRNKVELALAGLKKHCKILCNNSSKKSTACLNYSLGLCIGMCVKDTTLDQYMIQFDRIFNMLKGKDYTLLKEMEEAMNLAAEKFDFETAALYRDYINAVKSLLNKASLLKFAKGNKNIVLLEYLENQIFKLFLIKGNKVIFNKKYDLQNYDLGELKTNILFYFNPKNFSNPKKVGSEEIDEAQIIYSYLKRSSNDCKYVIIHKKWLNSYNSKDIDTAINKLFS